MHDPLDITNKETLFRLLAQHRNGKARTINELEMRSTIRRRVQGQDHIIDELCRFIRLQWGKEKRSKPIASILFVGPPATGKTEMAKALTEYLFEDEKHMLRFDCSELSGVEGKTRLIGTPTGYQGASQGGQLTRPMLAKPQRLILFDEIEKAYAGVFDLFLSVMGEGRMTEQGSGKVADFTQAVIVLTSNAQHEAISGLMSQFDDPFELGQAVRGVLREAQSFRPEIISRFDQVYVFKTLEDDTVLSRIATSKIIKAAEEYGVTIRSIDPAIVCQIMKPGEAEMDVRELTRQIDSKLGDVLLASREQGWQEVEITSDENGMPAVYPFHLESFESP